MDGTPHPTSVSEDTWTVLALLSAPGTEKRHVALLEALRTFAPHPVTGIRWVKQDRLARAAGLHLDTLRRARRELADGGVIWYRPGVGRGRAGEYWIIPVAPEKVDPPPGKGGSLSPPFLTPGAGGRPARKKVGSTPRKRYEAKSADLRRSEPQGKSPQSTRTGGHPPDPPHGQGQDQDPGGNYQDPPRPPRGVTGSQPEPATAPAGFHRDHEVTPEQDRHGDDDGSDDGQARPGTGRHRDDRPAPGTDQPPAARSTRQPDDGSDLQAPGARADGQDDGVNAAFLARLDATRPRMAEQVRRNLAQDRSTVPPHNDHRPTEEP